MSENELSIKITPPVVKQMIDELQPAKHQGFLPNVQPCPYCQVHMSRTAFQTHETACRAGFLQAPGQHSDPWGDIPNTSGNQPRGN